MAKRPSANESAEAGKVKVAAGVSPVSFNPRSSWSIEPGLAMIHGAAITCLSRHRACDVKGTL